MSSRPPSTADSTVSPRRSLFSSLSYTSSTTSSSRTSIGPSGGEAPTDPLPRDGQTSRPSDVVINRLHEVKRITKSLANYFDGVASAHNAHAAQLLKLSAPSVIQTPLPESSLFIPVPQPPAKNAPQNQNVQFGWADLLNQIRDGNKAVAEEHLELAKNVSKNVVLPLKKLRTDIKTHIQAMEKEVSKLADVVLKERESTVVHLSHLSRALHPPPIPSGLNTPPNISPNDDPFLHNITVETQLRAQTVKENELLALVQSWQEKSEKLEKDVWQKVNDAWSVWQVGNSTMLLENQQRSMFLSANVDSVHPDAEWTHFQKLNYLIPRDLPATPLDDIEHVHKGDPQTIAIRSGVLERQKRFLKTWNAAHFILTPAGNLHEYKSSDSPLDKPVVSLHLPACIIGPMPTPEPSTKGRQLDAMFTIEGPDSRNVFRAKSWEELSSWWVEIDQFTKKLPLPDDPSTPVDEDEADIGQALKAEKAAAGEEEEPKTPPALPPRKEDETRSPPALPPRAANRLSGGLPAPIDTDLAPAEADIGTPTAEEPHHEPEESDISLHDDGDDSAPPAPIETEAPDSPSLSSPTSPVQGDGDVPEHSLHAQ